MSRVLDAERISRDELSKRIGRTGAYITQRMHLLGLIPALRDALDAGLVSVERGREVGRLFSGRAGISRGGRTAFPYGAS